MNNARRQGPAARRGITRGRLLQSGTAVLAARASGAAPHVQAAAKPGAAGGESVKAILDTLLGAEQLLMTLYHAGLTTPAIMRDRKLAGSSANPNAVGRDGNRANVAYLQVALDQEQKHSELLKNAGAVSSLAQVHFPAAAFDTLGYTSASGTFLWLVDHLETVAIAAYVAAVRGFGQLGRPDLALLATRILSVECTHRVLYRVIAGDDPAANVTLEIDEFPRVAAAADVMRPFVTGQGFGISAIVTKRLPVAPQVRRIVGKNSST